MELSKKMKELLERMVMKMKKVMKALSLLMAAVLVLACFAGCTGGNGAQESTNAAGASNTQTLSKVDQIKAKGELVMLTNATFPPFEYIEGGEVVGVDVDIANEIAKELGVKLTVQDMEFDLITDYIKAGKGDIGAAGISISDERKKQVDFSNEYITSTQYVIVPAGTDTKSFKLDGKVIGVQEGTTGDIYYASEPKVIKAKEVKKYKSAIDAAADMLLGRVDCVIIDELPAKKITEKNTGKMICYNPGYEPESYAIAIKKGSDDLAQVVNQVLTRLKDEGKIDQYLLNHTS